MLLSADRSFFLTGMAKWELCFALLLPLTVCFDSEVTLEKTIGRESDVTPICPNATLSNITLIVCTIRREWSGEMCRLLYRYRENFVQGCNSSKFTLMEENQTVFLHLTSLTPVDSGNYTCECSDPEGTYTLHLNIIVKDEARSSQMQPILIGVATVVIITAAIVGFIYRRMHNGRGRPEAPGIHPNVEPEDIEPYGTFIQRESGLYSTVQLHVCNTNITTEDTPTGSF